MNKHFLLICLCISTQILFAQNESMTPFEQEMDSLLLVANKLILEYKLEEGLKLTEGSENRIIEKFGNKHWLLIQAKTNLGKYFIQKAKKQAALEEFQEAHDLIIELYDGEHPLYFYLSTAIASLKGQLGAFDEATKLLLETKKQIENEEEINNEDLFFCLKTIANNYSLAGQLELAERTVINAFEVSKLYGFQNTKSHVHLLMTAGNLYEKTGRTQRAFEYFEKAEDLYTRLGMTKTINFAVMFINISKAQLDLRELDESEASLLKAKALIEELLGKDNALYFACLQNLAATYGTGGDAVKALGVLEEIAAWTEKKFPPSHKQNLIAHTNMAVNNFNLENYEKSRNILFDIVEIILKNYGEKHQYLATISNLLAHSYFKLDDNANGTKYAAIASRTTLTELERGFLFLSEEELADFTKAHFFTLDNIYQLAQITPDAQALAAVCYDNILFQKGFLLNAVKEIKTSTQKNPEAAKLYEQYKSVTKKLGSELSKPLAEQTAAESLKNEVKKLEKDLVLKIGLSKNSFQRVTWEEVQRQLPENSVAIEIVDFKTTKKNENRGFHPTDYAAIILSSEKELPKFIRLFEEEALEDLSNPQAIYALKKTENKPHLKSLIWDKIALELEGIQKIYYSPSGQMHLINFGAIPINDTKTIADKFEIQSLRSTRQLVVSDKATDYVSNDAVIFGGVKYDLESKNISPTNSTLEIKNTRSLFFNEDEWRFLKWTEKEADKIGELLTSSGIKSQVFKNKKATEEVFKKIGVKEKSPRILHLATHGYFFSKADTSAKTGFEAAQNPLIRSGLILAGGNAAWVGKAPLSGEDGILTAHEIAQMDLSNTELVVLSACETGLGDIKGSEGVYGLQRAFKLAGAKYILMSLWEVKDRKTYQFMSLFYEKLLSGKSVPKAYQFAQSAMHEKYKLPFNPINWAGFVLVE